MNNPTLSVIMSVYNGEDHLYEAIESILNQTYKKFEFIIIDDGSIDNSLHIIKKFQNKDNRIAVISRKNKGQACSLNEGIRQAKGKYIAIMDADDVSFINRFDKQVDFLEKNKDVGVCGSWITSVLNLPIKTPVSNDEAKVALLFSSCVAHSTVLMRKNVLDKLDFVYKESLIRAQDYDLWTRLINVTKFYNIPEVLLKYRYHSGQYKNKKIEYEMSHKVRDCYLKSICNDITNEESEVFTRIVENLHVDKEVRKIVINKILKANKESGVLDNVILIKRLNKHGLMPSQMFKRIIRPIKLILIRVLAKRVF